MKLREIMSRNIEVIYPDDSIQIAAQKMRTRDVGLLPVCEGDHVVGTVSDRDITVRATAKGLEPKTTLIRELMTPAAVCCFEDQSIDEAARLMRDNQIRRLVVLNHNDQCVAGMLSLGDMAAYAGDNILTLDVLRSVSTRSALR